MSEPDRDRAPRGPLRLLTRGAVLFLLIAAPLALGSVHQETFWPFIGLSSFAGVASWARARWARANGEAVRRVPGWRLLLAFNLLVWLQLLPLPPSVLHLLSPHALEFHREGLGTGASAAATAWFPLTVSPYRTGRAVWYLAALSLFYGAVVRDCGRERHRRRLAGTIVGVAFVMTLVGFVQKASADPGRIYGLWKPDLSHAVFGPYVNRSHYAGYVVMAIPLVLAFAVDSFQEVRRQWRRRARRLTALGEPAASATAIRVALALFIASGVLSAGSRTGVVACLVSAIAIPIAFGRRGFQALALVLLIATASLLFVDLQWFLSTFNRATFEADRVVLWHDLFPVARDFRWFGVGFGALAPIYQRSYQTVHLWGYWEQAHNEYYEVLLDTGILGATIVTGLLAILFRRAFRAAGRGAFGAGLLGALIANATTNLADFNLQIPANAATFAAIAAISVVQGSRERSQE